jgi:hypothetical protein
MKALLTKLGVVKNDLCVERPRRLQRPIKGF